MNLIVLNQKIRYYLELSSLVNTVGTSSPSYELLTSRLIDLEEEILIRFGLPPSAYCYTARMESFGHSDTNIIRAADELYRWLENEAIIYLTSPVKSDIEILCDGRERMLHAAEWLHGYIFACDHQPFYTLNSCNNTKWQYLIRTCCLSILPVV